MSVINILKSVSIVLIGALFGYQFVKYISTDEIKQNRFIASAPYAKLGQEQIARSLFELNLDLNELAKTEAGVSTVKVIFTAFKNIPNGLSYRWVLPDGVTLIDGPLQDAIGDIKAGETREYILKLTGFSKELKKYLSFEVLGVLNNFSVKQELLISSRIEDSMEYLIQQNALKRQAAGVQNIGGKIKSKYSSENVIR